MISPSPKDRAAPGARRCVVYLREVGPVTVASERGVTRMRNLTAFLEWLTSPSIARPASQVWLSPNSAGWDLLVTQLLAAGYEVRLSRRQGEYLGLWIGKAGEAIGEADAGAKGRSWYGGSASGLVTVDPDLSAEEETRVTWEALQRLDDRVRAHWPGAGLESSVAGTAVSAFKTALDRPVGLSKAVAAELLELDAYGGGHIERYCARGATYHASAGEPPYEIDLASAYPTAMQRLSIPGDFVAFAGESEAMDPCRIATCLVTVPERRYPPLRYRIGKSQYYPHGTLLGTWTAVELRAAVAAGCRIERVVKVYAFEDRSDVFGSFADSLVTFRRLAETPAERDFAKALSVQFVGALGSRPKTLRCTTRPESIAGCRFDRPGLYSEPVFSPSERQILSAASTITGGVAAWLGLLLRACELQELPVYYVHTDGGGTIGDPRGALALLQALGTSDPELRIPEGIRMLPESHGSPGTGAWKVEPLAHATCWAPNRRISTTFGGERRIAAGGISRTLTEQEILAEVRADAASGWTRSHRREGGAWTYPLSVADLDPDAAQEAALIVAQ